MVDVVGLGATVDLRKNDRHVVSFAARLEIIEKLASFLGERRPVVYFISKFLCLQAEAIGCLLQVDHLGYIDIIGFPPRHRLLDAVFDVALEQVVPDAV